MLPGHPWHILEAGGDADTFDAYNTKRMETKKELVKNCALEKFAHTKAILVKLWLAANNHGNK